MESGRPLYEHTQIGWSMLIGIVILISIFLVMPRLVTGAPPVIISLTSGLAALTAGLTLLLFSTLTVRVERHRLAWHFGLGLVRFRIALDQIESVERSKVSWASGFGIHRTARGWLHNVSGRDVVVIRRKDGKRTLLGSDEPARLAATIERAIAQAAR